MARESELIECEGKLIVPVEYLRWLYAERRRINAHDLASIVWTEDGKPWDVTPEEIADFRFTGLNNCDFVVGNFTIMQIEGSDHDRTGMADL